MPLLLLDSIPLTHLGHCEETIVQTKWCEHLKKVFECGSIDGTFGFSQESGLEFRRRYCFIFFDLVKVCWLGEASLQVKL